MLPLPVPRLGIGSHTANSSSDSESDSGSETDSDDGICMTQGDPLIVSSQSQLFPQNLTKFLEFGNIKLCTILIVQTLLTEYG